MKLKALFPLLIFMALVALFMMSLGKDTRLVPSALIGKPAPGFQLAELNSEQTISPEKLVGQRWLLNVWASWCAACKQEHPYLNQLAATTDYLLVGLNYKDSDAAAKTWLDERGDPYQLIAVDDKGSAGLDWGVYGVPETFLIDENGIIQYKHIGPLNMKVINELVLPFLETGEIS
jgi:cytochrome c biogenesis protein CcmG/thiol:disulfide interchange protein DsbE